MPPGFPLVTIRSLNGLSISYFLFLAGLAGKRPPSPSGCEIRIAARGL